MEWGAWFLSDRATRSVAPGFTITPAETEKLADTLSAPRRSCELSGAPGSLSTLNVLGCLRVAKKFPGRLTAHRRSCSLLRTARERAARGRSGQARTTSTAVASGESAQIDGSAPWMRRSFARARGVGDPGVARVPRCARMNPCLWRIRAGGFLEKSSSDWAGYRSHSLKRPSSAC